MSAWIHALARRIVQSWPWNRGRWRIISLLSKVVLGSDESVAPIGKIAFPFQSYQWNFYFGLFEVETKQLLNTLLRTGDVFVDIGANVGYFSAVAADAVGPSGRVISSEPEPVHFARLERLANLNADYSIICHRQALSDCDGTAQFYVCEHPGWHSLMKDFPNAPIAQTIDVVTTTLDQMLNDYSLMCESSVRVVKIDVEGAELLVLSGASQTLTMRCVDFYLVEISPTLGLEPLKRFFDEPGYMPFEWDAVRGKWIRARCLQSEERIENILWARPGSHPALIE
ncbi:MAG: FkbM family methyltransferase [Verrucomicrobiales bacterium]|nr:FkbM family methyltransferase [Verrucomicrobiales bacterium]